MKCLITGGKGFLGSYVVKEFRQAGHEVIVLSNLSNPSPNMYGEEFMYGDIRYQYETDKAIEGVDCVIHLAARINVDRSRENPRAFLDTNVIGTFNILESCRRYKKKLIHASTSEALGAMQEEYCWKIDDEDPEQPAVPFETIGMAEHHPYSPDNPYGTMKAAADMLVIGYVNSYGVDATILRSFNMTGVGQSSGKEGAFIPKVINKIIQGENPIIFGSGEQRRDYIWAGDVAKAYLLLAESEQKGQVFHVGSGTEVSIRSVAESLIRISGKSLEISYIEARPQEIRSLKCDWSKIGKLGWKPTKTLDEILEEMYLASKPREYWKSSSLIGVNQLYDC